MSKQKEPTPPSPPEPEEESPSDPLLMALPPVEVETELPPEPATSSGDSLNSELSALLAETRQLSEHNLRLMRENLQQTIGLLQKAHHETLVNSQMLLKVVDERDEKNQQHVERLERLVETLSSHLENLATVVEALVIGTAEELHPEEAETPPS